MNLTDLLIRIPEPRILIDLPIQIPEPTSLIDWLKPTLGLETPTD